jgi:TadE-like protein
MNRLFDRLMSYARSQRSQGLTEFAIIAPVILLLTFGIIDFGRALYLYITLQQAANEGARVAVRASYYVDVNGVGCAQPLFLHCYPSDTDVANAVQGHAVTMNLANYPACPNGPLPNGGIPSGSPQLPAPNTGWIFITDPSTAGNGHPNGPAGGLGTYPDPSGNPLCDSVQLAGANDPIKVTIWYSFQPVTPLIQQAIGNRVVITAYAVYRAEYSR